MILRGLANYNAFSLEWNEAVCVVGFELEKKAFALLKMDICPLNRPWTVLG
jgi:hypothetical protein